MNLIPQFSTALITLMAEHNLTQVNAAKISGLARNIIVRFARGDQWPNHKHIAAVMLLANNAEERGTLIRALQGDIAAAAGADRYKVSEDTDAALMQVPLDLVRLVEGAILLAHTSRTGKVALEAVIDSLTPEILRTAALDSDAVAFQARPKSVRKNVSAPSARPSFPPRSKAS